MSNSLFPKSQYPVILTGSVTAQGDLPRQITDGTKELQEGALVGNLILLRKGNVDYVRTIVDCNGESIVFAPGIYDGTVAGFVYGEPDGGEITVETVVIGTDQNDYTAVIENGLDNDEPTDATLVGDVLTITIGTAADGVPSSAAIGTGTNGVVAIFFAGVGERGDDYTVTVVVAETENADMSVELVEKDLIVTLGTDENGDADAAKNLASLVAAEIDTLPQFSATASGDGSTALVIAEAEQFFAGGINPTPIGTAAAVVTAINLLEPFTATMTGSGGVLAETTDAIPFAGGTDAIFPIVGEEYLVLSRPTQQSTTFFERMTGSTALSETFGANVDWMIEEIRIHLSAAGGAGNLTITVDSAEGTAFDTLLLTQDMTAITNLVWRPDYPMKFEAGDMVDIAWENANSRTYGIEIVYSVI